MNKRSSATARIVAVTALVIAAIVVIVAVGVALSNSGSSSGGHGHGHGSKGHKAAAKKQAPATYEVQSGDTLLSIAHQTGVPLRTIEELNPQVDPQILIAGETLELK